MSSGNSTSVAAVTAEELYLTQSKPASFWHDAWKRLIRNKAAVVSGVLIVIICLSALLAPVITTVSFEVQDTSNILASPDLMTILFGSSEERALVLNKPIINWLGTDTLGRDLYSRIVYGARMSMAVGFITAFFALLFGTLYGSISGYIGGKVDNAMMRVIDVLLTIPDLLLAILIGVFFGRGLVGIFLALSIVGWLNEARLVRAQVLQVKEMTYVEAARALGTSPFAIVFRHIVPNILGPIIVTLTYQIPASILAESFLSFIGLGLSPPYSSWGTLANDGWKAFKSYPHLFITPGFFIFITILAFNFFGDGLRDALDPKLKNQQGT